MCLRRQLSRAGSVLNLSRPELTECLAVLLEVRRREVVDLMLLQKGVHLHARFETKKPAQLSGCERMGSICFERQALERCSRQVLPLGFQSLRDVFRQVQCNLHASVPSAHYLHVQRLRGTVYCLTRTGGGSRR